MKDRRKAAPTGSGNTLAGEQISYCKYSHRSRKSKRKINFSDTQSQAFAAIQRLIGAGTADKPHYADCVRPARCRIYPRNR